MNEVRFYIDIPADELMRYYQGRVQSVLVHADDGRRIQFPAEHLRAHVSRYGVKGRFALQFDGRNKLVALRRLR